VAGKNASKYSIRSSAQKGATTGASVPPAASNTATQPGSATEAPIASPPIGIKPEPIPDVDASPILTPRKVRAYTTEHLKDGNSQTPSPETDQTPPVETDSEPTSGSEGSEPKISVNGPPPPSSDSPFGETPPPDENTAEDQDIDPNSPPEQPATPGVSLPPGYSSSTAKRILDGVDYALKNYGKYLTDIRVTKKIKYADRISEIPEHKNIEATIEQQNEKTRKKLPFEKEDRQLLDPALERYMRETQMVVTPLQELLGVVALVLIKKVPDVISILNEKNEMLKHITLEVDRIIKAWEAKEKKDHPDSRVSDAEIVDDKKDTN